MFSKPRSWRKIGGTFIHFLIGAMMIAAGIFKLAGTLSPEIVDALKKQGIYDNLALIGVGEIVTGVLLIIPHTSSLGVLLTSSFWGGAICLHLTQGEPIILQSVLLVLTWIGGWLRNPGLLASFWGQ
jgi:hypothetical protein